MKKYLVILPNNLGDVIMALPVLEALKRDAGNHVTFFVEDGFEEGIRDSGFYDELLLFNRKEIKDFLRSEKWHNGIDSIRVFINEIHSRAFDVIINLCQHNYVATLVGLLKAESILGRCLLKEGGHAITDPWSQYLYAIPFARKYNRLHAVDVYKYIAGVSDIPARGSISVADHDLCLAKYFLRQDGKPDEQPTVLVHPGAAYASKMWHVENFVSLTRKLIDLGMWIVITGSGNEKAIGSAIKQTVGRNCTVTSGLFTFRQSLAFASICDYCITGDTAMMHAASALNKKVFAFFGPTNPVETGPYGEGHTIFAGRCTARPCFCFECKTKICMKSITPEIVFEYITTGRIHSSSCDVYTTVFSATATWALAPVIEHGTPYSDEMRADFTRKAFDSAWVCKKPSTEALHELVLECEYIVDCIASMEQQLSKYLVSRDMLHIRAFEQLRTEISTKSGIAEFFTAVLNIGLNSIPLFNLLNAVKDSIETCKKIRQMVRGTLHAMQTL